MEKDVNQYIKQAKRKLKLSLGELLERQDKKISDNLKYINSTQKKNDSDFGEGYQERTKFRNSQIDSMHKAILWRMEIKKEIKLMLESDNKPV